MDDILLGLANIKPADDLPWSNVRVIEDPFKRVIATDYIPERTHLGFLYGIPQYAEDAEYTSELFVIDEDRVLDVNETHRSANPNPLVYMREGQFECMQANCVLIECELDTGVPRFALMTTKMISPGEELVYHAGVFEYNT